jgi:hypothetical protein
MKTDVTTIEYFLYENCSAFPILTKDGMYFDSIESARKSNFSCYSNKARFKIGKVMKTINLVGVDCDPASKEEAELETVMRKIAQDVDKEWEEYKRLDSDMEEEIDFKSCRRMANFMIIHCSKKNNE